MEVSCCCCGKNISSSTERRRLSNAEGVFLTLVHLLGNCVHEHGAIETLWRGCVCRHCFSRLQRYARLQADIRSLRDDLETSLRAVYGSEDTTVLGKHSLEVAVESGSADEASLACTPARKHTCPRSKRIFRSLHHQRRP